MKICVISPLGYTGIAYYDFGLCYALSEAGLAVDLFSVDDYIVGKEPNFNKEAIFINTYGDISRIKKGIYYLQALVKSFFLILKKNYDIIHFQKMELPILDCGLFVLLKFARKKIVYTPHDIMPYKYKRVRYPIYLSYKLSDLLIVHNEKNLIDMIDHFGIKRDKISIVPHGNYNYFLQGIQRSEARLMLSMPTDKKVLLLFGNIKEGRGIETTISALKYLKNKTDILLLIAGKAYRGFDFEGMKKLIKDNGLENFVLIRNEFIEDSLVESYYRACDVVVIPYERGYESGVLRYAFSCGLPVVVSNLKEFSSFAEDGENCLIFKKGEFKHLAKRLNLLLENKTLQHTIARNAKKLSDTEWGWDKLASQTKRLYEALLEQ
jgi:glycosyltransferase involved in cell wall biosynthesis